MSRKTQTPEQLDDLWRRYCDRLTPVSELIKASGMSMSAFYRWVSARKAQETNGKPRGE